MNSPLRAIHSNIEMTGMLADRIEEAMSGFTGDEGDKVKNLLLKLKKANETNLQASQRIIMIVKKLKIFARLDEADWQDADLHEGLECVFTLMSVS